MKLAPSRGGLLAAVGRILGAVVLIIALGPAFLWWCTLMPGASFSGEAPALSADDAALRARLEAHVIFFGGEVGIRHVGVPAKLQAAVAHIEDTWQDAGFTVRKQPIATAGRTAHNLEIELKGTTRPEQVVVLGAHYDTAPHTPGADDNGSGVAAILELARLLDRSKLQRTVRLVAFANEEPPFFKQAEMGSLVYAGRCREQGVDVRAMVSVESIGYYTDEVGVQRYPPVLGWFFPAEGDYLAFVGNVSSRGIVRDAIGAFRERATLPSEGLAAPQAINGIDWSDHWAFWQHGYPALMITDTAIMRNRHYHRPTDLPGTLDYDRFTRAVTGLVDVVYALASP